MKTQVLSRLVMSLVIAGVGIAAAATNPATVPQTDTDLVRQVTHEIRMYPYYSIWDDIGFRVNNGQVELTGAVTQPWKKSDIEHIIQHAPGVTSVTDRIEVLPLSSMDDQLRLQVARAIFRDPVLSRYAMEPIPSIHIIVDNGHVTLTGFVESQSDKNLAALRAESAGMSFGPVVNDLRVARS